MSTTKRTCDCTETCDCLKPLKKCKPDAPSRTIRKLCMLLEEPMSSHLYDRQWLLIEEYLEVTKYSIMMQDIPFVTRILELMTEALQNVPMYRGALIRFLELCKIRPELQKASECLSCVQDFTQYFNMFGYLLSITEDDSEMQIMVMNVLSSIFNKKRELPKSCVKLETCYECLELSQLPESIVELLLISSEKLYSLLLKFACILANSTSVLCAKLAKAGALDFILIRMEPNWKTRNPHVPPAVAYSDSNVILHFEETCKVFWRILKNLSDLSKESLMQISPAGLQALWSLQYVHRITVKHKSRRDERNLIMILIIKYYSLFPKLALIKSGLAEDIVQLSVATEIKLISKWAENVTFEIDEHDYYYKKMLLLMNCLLMKNDDPYVRFAIKSIMKENMMITGLLRLIIPGIGSAWHPQLYRRLTDLGLRNLHLVLPHFTVDFVGNNGVLTLITMVEMFKYHEYEPYLLHGILKTIYFSLTLDCPRIKREMRELKVYNVLLGMCKYMLDKSVLTLVNQKCLGLCFAALEILLSFVPFTGGRATEICLTALERVLKPTNDDTIMDTMTVTCFLTYFWEVINSESQLLAVFNMAGGIYKLLDLILMYDYPVKLVGLGFLVDLVEEVSSVPFVITWRNKGNNILKLLIEIFRSENESMGTRHTDRGVIKDIEYPLMGQKQILATQSKDKDSNSSPAYADLLASCRPKIYAILELLNYRHLEAVNLANEHSRLYDYSTLNADEKVSLLLIQNYLALKLGEAWIELDKDLERTGMRPIGLDFEIIQNLKRRHRYWSQNIKSKQEDELQQDTNININDERKTYRMLKDARLSDSLEALHELEYIARTTDRQFLLMRKNKQSRDVAKLLRFPDNAENAEVSKHRTFMHDLNVTPVFGQTLSIQSSPAAKKALGGIYIDASKKPTKLFSSTM